MLVQLAQFEGPLGLLLYLIRKEEMDIYDIPIHKITKQYLAYVKQMESFDLEKAGDFVAMAATLIQIKARMLLPTYNEEGEEEIIEDPRKQLVNQLLEYEKFQEGARLLNDRPLLGRDTFKRGSREFIPQEDAGIAVEEEAFFGLIKCYRDIIKKAAKAKHTVSAKFQSIASRILELADRILPGKRVVLQELEQSWDKTKYLITFLSTLELGKLGFISLFQSEDCGPIYIDGKQDINGDIVTRVAEYDDGLDASQKEQQTVLQEQKTTVAEHEEEMASDEEIFAAELELEEEETRTAFAENDSEQPIMTEEELTALDSQQKALSDFYGEEGHSVDEVAEEVESSINVVEINEYNSVKDEPSV